MNKQHTEDYKLSAIKFYLENKENMTQQQVCDIFKCKQVLKML
jgi:hypothetical protein